MKEKAMKIKHTLILRLGAGNLTIVYVLYILVAKGDLSFISKLKLATEIYSACLLEGLFFFVLTDITGVFSEKHRA